MAKLQAKHSGIGSAQERHLIRDNTDFRLVYERKKDYFFHGDLATLEHYENSSIPPGGNAANLDYKATVVVPIRYAYTKQDLDSLEGNSSQNSSQNRSRDQNQDLYGFLALDCEPRNSFDERYDVELGNVIADALVATLDAYSRVREELKPRGRIEHLSKE